MQNKQGNQQQEYPQLVRKSLLKPQKQSKQGIGKNDAPHPMPKTKLCYYYNPILMKGCFKGD